MPHIFETVTGSEGALSFQFNGQFALKNYNVEIINGNRLRVVSNTNEMFSLLEAEVSEVEINGQIYSDANAAQLALQTLVYSNAKPVVLTEEMYIKLAAAVQAADRGILFTDSPMPLGGWQIGWYTPGTSSVSPGTNYPNQNNLKADSDYISKFYYNGTSWILQTSKIPESKAFIPAFSTMTFPLSGDVQVTHLDRYWQLIEGKTALASDIPSDDSLVWKSMGGGNEDERWVIGSSDSEYYEDVYNSAGWALGDGTSWSESLKIPVKKDSIIQYKLWTIHGGHAVRFFASMVSDYTPLYIAQNDGYNIGEVVVPADGFIVFAVGGKGDTEPFFKLQKGGIFYSSAKDLQEYSDNKVKPYDTVLHSFLNPENRIFDNKQATAGVIFNKDVIVGDPAGKILRLDLSDIDSIKIHARPLYAFDTVAYSMLVAKNKQGNWISLLPAKLSSDYEDFEVNLERKYSDAIVCYGVSQVAEDESFKVILVNLDDPILFEPILDSVKKYIDNKTSDIKIPYQKEGLRYFDKPKTIARMEVEGDLPTDTSDARTPTKVKVKMYCNNTLLLDCHGTFAIQGSSSVQLYVKKGYTFDLMDEVGGAVEVKIGTWESGDSFHMKGYATDSTMCRDVGSVQMWHDIRTERDYPSSFISNPDMVGTDSNAKANRYDGANFFTDGFPVAMYFKGEFFGLYVFRQKKSNKNYRIDDANKNHIFLANSNAASLTWSSFKHEEWELKSPKIAGYQENGSITDAVVLGNIDRLYTYLNLLRTNSVDFESTVNQYLNVDSIVDYIIISQLCHHWDNWDNNIMWITWDSQVWSVVPYDFDFTMGKIHPFWDGTFPDNSANTLVWRGYMWSTVIYPKFLSRIKTRWTQLRNDRKINVNLMEKRFGDIMKLIGRDLYRADMSKWEYVRPEKDNLKSILKFGHQKITYLDSIWKI